MWPTQGPQTFTCTWIFIRRKHCLIPGSWMWCSNSSSANGCHCSYFLPSQVRCPYHWRSVFVTSRLSLREWFFTRVLQIQPWYNLQLWNCVILRWWVFSKKMISTFQEEITDRAKVTQTVSSRLVSILVITLHVQPYHSLLSCSQHTWIGTSQLDWLISTFEQSLPAFMAPSSKNTTMEQQSEAWHLQGQ